MSLITVTPAFIAAVLGDIPRDLTVQEVNDALASIDEQAEIDAAAARVEVAEFVGTVFNGVDLLNHPTPSYRAEVEATIGQGGKGYTIAVDGSVQYLQLHVPRVDGIQLLTSENIAGHMEAHRQLVVDEKATEAVIALLRERLVSDA